MPLCRSPHCLCLSTEVAEVLQALKWAQHCLHDAQSQQDVELIMQLVVKEDFRNAFTIYSAVAQQMAMVSPTSPLTAQAEDLCMEVRTMVLLKLNEAPKTNLCLR